MFYCWFWKVQLIMVVVGVDSRCGYYSEQQKNYELPQIRIETKLGNDVSLEIPIHKGDSSVFHRIIKPNGEEIDVVNNELTRNIGVDDGCTKKFHNMSPNEQIEENIVKIIDKDNEMKADEMCKNINHKLHNFKFTNDSNIMVVGPMSEDDHGQWLISTCYSDERNNSVQIFRIYDISIQETIETIPKEIIVTSGEDLKFSLGRKLANLEGCQLVTPDNTVDRGYERNVEMKNTCSYIVKRVNKEDAGTWTVVALAKIIYIGHLDVRVLEV